MKKTALCIAILMTISSFGWSMVARAGEMPTVPLTSSPTRIAGDANGNRKIGLDDVALILRKLAGGWDVTIDESASDVNGDHVVNLKDVTLIRRYIAGGWNVTLQ